MITDAITLMTFRYVLAVLLSSTENQRFIKILDFVTPTSERKLEIYAAFAHFLQPYVPIENPLHNFLPVIYNACPIFATHSSMAWFNNIKRLLDKLADTYPNSTRTRRIQIAIITNKLYVIINNPPPLTNIPPPIDPYIMTPSDYYNSEYGYDCFDTISQLDLATLEHYI